LEGSVDVTEKATAAQVCPEMMLAGSIALSTLVGSGAKQKDEVLLGWTCGRLILLRAAVVVIPLSHYFIFMWRGRRGLLDANGLIVGNSVVLVIVKRKIEGR
jgi:hypothetical protein